MNWQRGYHVQNKTVQISIIMQKMPESVRLAWAVVVQLLYMLTSF